MVMTIGKAMIMLPIVANLEVIEHISETIGHWNHINKVLANQLKIMVPNMQNKNTLDIEFDTRACIQKL